MIEIILLIISAIVGVVLMSVPKIEPTPTPTIKPKKRVRFKEPIMSYAQTNHVTSELMRQKAELSRNNNPGNELLHVNKFNWPPSVNY